MYITSDLLQKCILAHAMPPVLCGVNASVSRIPVSEQRTRFEGQQPPCRQELDYTLAAEDPKQQA